MATYECSECGYEQEQPGRCPECDIDLEAQKTEEVVDGGELAGTDEVVKEEGEEETTAGDQEETVL